MKKTVLSKMSGKTDKTGACVLRIFAAARFKVFLNHTKFCIKPAIGVIEAIQLTSRNPAKLTPRRA
jgi:hypothetical protein